jgi:hypothetical protein
MLIIYGWRKNKHYSILSWKLYPALNVSCLRHSCDHKKIHYGKNFFLHYCQQFSRKLYPALDLFYFGLRKILQTHNHFRLKNHYDAKETFFYIVEK